MATRGRSPAPGRRGTRQTVFRSRLRRSAIGASSWAPPNCLASRDGGQTWVPRQRLPSGRSAPSFRATASRARESSSRANRARCMARAMTNILRPWPVPFRAASFGGLTGARAGQVLLYGLRGRAFWSSDAGARWRPGRRGMPASLTAGLPAPRRHAAVGHAIGPPAAQRGPGTTLAADRAAPAGPRSGAARDPRRHVDRRPAGGGHVELAAQWSPRAAAGGAPWIDFPVVAQYEFDPA